MMTNPNSAHARWAPAPPPSPSAPSAPRRMRSDNYGLPLDPRDRAGYDDLLELPNTKKAK